MRTLTSVRLLALAGALAVALTSRVAGIVSAAAHSGGLAHHLG